MSGLSGFICRDAFQRFWNDSEASSCHALLRGCTLDDPLKIQLQTSKYSNRTKSYSNCFQFLLLLPSIFLSLLQVLETLFRHLLTFWVFFHVSGKLWLDLVSWGLVLLVLGAIWTKNHLMDASCDSDSSFPVFTNISMIRNYKRPSRAIKSFSKARCDG